MPLPPNSTITLQGHSVASSKPKVAMIVRMTEETLDVLANLTATDRMDFEFGDKAAIHIQDKSFPMRYNKEKDNQELFIRTTGARLNNPPLKLSANVIGKFVVERGLDDKLRKQIHDATAEAKKLREERKTVMLDTPPSLTAVGTKAAQKKKAAARTTTKPTPVFTTKSYATTAPSQQPKETIPSTSSISPEVVNQYRQRLIHYFALGPASQPDAVKNVGGVEADREHRLKITEILNDVAEMEQLSRKAASASADTKWKLKPQSWLEVRPYQYPDYTENVRTSVARQARLWLDSLKIPKANEAWEHVKFRNAAGSGGTSSTVPRPANGTMSSTTKKGKTAKETKPKPQEVKVKSEAASHEMERPRVPPASERLQAPIETRPPSMRPDKGKHRESEKEEGELSASETPPHRTPVPTRRSVTPVKRPPPIATNQRLEPPVPRASGANTPTMHPPASPRPPMAPPSSSAVPSKRTGPVDVRSSKRPPPEQSERGHAMPPILPPTSGRNTPVQVQVKKEVVTVKKERPVVPSHRPSGSVTLTEKERAALRRERNGSDRESLRGVKRRDRDESDRESLRAAKKERLSDRESLDGRERVREREKVRDIEARRREREIESSRVARDKEVARHREEPPRERPLASTATATTKPSKKRKELDDSGDESSDWGIEDRQPRKTAAKAKIERVSPVPPRQSSSVKPMRKERELSPPPRKVKRESPPMPTKAASSSAKTKAEPSAASRPVKRDLKDDGGRERASSSKPSKRRRSPIYTSSEDEEDKVRPKKVKTEGKVPPAPPPTAASDNARPRANRPLPPPASSSNSTSTSAAATPVSYPPKMMPHPSAVVSKTKDKTPRERYGSLFPDYLGSASRLLTQKSKFENFLTNFGHQSSVSLSEDSGEEGERMLYLDELAELRATYDGMHGELKGIYDTKAKTKSKVKVLRGRTE